jgi:hypothetical protein
MCCPLEKTTLCTSAGIFNDSVPIYSCEVD